jgi:hypothetical protein
MLGNHSQEIRECYQQAAHCEDHVLATFKTQHEAIDWAKKNGHSPHVARVRHLNNKKEADHWRAA